jgi:hypothetical protein
VWLLAAAQWKSVEPEEHTIGGGNVVTITVAAREPVGERSECVVHIGG